MFRIIKSPLPRLTRSIHAPATAPARALPNLPGFESVESILKISQQGLEKHTSKFATVDEFFTKSTGDLRDAGVSVTERRAICWLREKLRQGNSPLALANPPPPKRTFRGWGDKVQNGLRK